MTRLTSAEIRQQFIDFFCQKHGHTFVPSSPVVPHDDPTLLFTNAGMNQFKPIFLGTEKRAYTRAANTQKCIRAGGKHNDLDDVGRSRRHHTFFEMLGNWSFGDYFKREAITWSWELLTEVWKLDPERLHVTVHAGDPAIGVERDDEAANIWREVARLPDDHIHYGNTNDNFWEMGETGPCGPCTEIFVDRTPDRTGGPSVLSGEDPRVMEIWNNVFIQYNRNPDKSLSVLPAQHVDTGMGLERIIQVLQGKDDNYGIDLFDPFWAKLTELSGITYTGKYPASNTADPVAEAADAQLRHDIAFRVIADHSRMATFAITDGALPGNKGRDSVVRSVIRRAVRFGYQALGLRRPFLWQLVPVVVAAMSDAFPELQLRQDQVAHAIMAEEESFLQTLERGLGLFEEAADRATSGGMMSGEDTFHLHTTYGFPVDLTKQMAMERGLRLDMGEYQELFDRFKEESGGKRASAIQYVSDMKGVEPTTDRAKFDQDELTATILAYGEGTPFTIVNTAGGTLEIGIEAALVLNRTCFYGEQGGQAGDSGEITTRGGVFRVDQTSRVGDYVLHEGVVTQGQIAVGEQARLEVSNARDRTKQNHTTTHLANWALREVLGEGVQQKGSLVDPEKLRFDFSHNKALAESELARVEELVTQAIERKLPVYAAEAPQEQALKINGLRAVFGEKYPPMVRVVSVGVPVDELLADPENARWRDYSVEFCGGTHLKSSEEAGGFVVTAEESVSKGIRRIVGLTGDAARTARESARQVDTLIESGAGAAGAEVAGVIAELNAALAVSNLPLRAKRRGQAALMELQSKQKAWEKSQKSAGAGVDAVALAAALLEHAPLLGPGKLIVGEIAGAANEQLLQAVDSLKRKAGSYGILVASADVEAGKVNFVAAVSDDLIAAGLKAGDWIRETAKVAGGGGGGRPQLAQAGGKDPSKLNDALEVARAFAMRVVG